MNKKVIFAVAAIPVVVLGYGFYRLTRLEKSIVVQAKTSRDDIAVLQKQISALHDSRVSVRRRRVRVHI